MEGELINVDLAVCEGHKEKVRHIKSKGDTDENIDVFFALFLRLVFKVYYRECDDRGKDNKVAYMPEIEAIERAGKLVVVGEDLVKILIEHWRFHKVTSFREILYHEARILSILIKKTVI